MKRASLVRADLPFRILALTPVFALMAIFILALLSARFTFAQSAPELKYDLKAEQTIHGTVLQVKKIPKAIGGQDGINLVVKTEKGDVEVEVGPAAFLDEMGVTFKSGDQVKVLASRCIEGRDLLSAREITQGENDTITLRDQKGEPVWTWMMKKG